MSQAASRLGLIGSPSACSDRSGLGVVAWPASSFMINQIQWAGYGAALLLRPDPDLAEQRP